jgi:hypothetical protein
MSTGPRDLLWQLLGYIAEQIKDIDPRGFQLSTSVRLIANELPKNAHSIRVFWIFWVVSI